MIANIISGGVMKKQYSILICLLVIISLISCDSGSGGGGTYVSSDCKSYAGTWHSVSRSLGGNSLTPSVLIIDTREMYLSSASDSGAADGNCTSTCSSRGIVVEDEDFTQPVIPSDDHPGAENMGETREGGFKVTISSGNCAGYGGGSVLSYKYELSKDYSKLTLTHPTGVEVYQRDSCTTEGKDSSGIKLAGNLSCNSVESSSICVEYSGGSWPDSFVTQQCVGGTINSGPCSSQNLVGSCKYLGNQALEFSRKYYSSGGTPYTAANAEDECQRCGGSWTP